MKKSYETCFSAQLLVLFATLVTSLLVLPVRLAVFAFSKIFSIFKNFKKNEKMKK